MPKIIIHAPESAFDGHSRQGIASELTEFALECESLPKSPFVKSTVWTYFNSYAADCIFMGEERATTAIISAQIYVIEGGLDVEAKKTLINGATAIFGRYLKVADRIPVYIVIHEIAESNWGIFGNNANLAALRSSAADAPAI